MMKAWVLKNRLSLIGIGIGAVGGGLYYQFVGCANGSCMIASNPFIAIPYGALMGYLLTGIFTKKEKTNSEKA